VNYHQRSVINRQERQRPACNLIAHGNERQNRMPVAFAHHLLDERNAIYLPDLKEDDAATVRSVVNQPPDPMSWMRQDELQLG
jgi:hypothetical protein